MSYTNDQAALVKLHQAMIDACEAIAQLEGTFDILCERAEEVVDFSSFIEGPEAFDFIMEMISEIASLKGLHK